MTPLPTSSDRTALAALAIGATRLCIRGRSLPMILPRASPRPLIHDFPVTSRDIKIPPGTLNRGPDPPPGVGMIVAPAGDEAGLRPLGGVICPPPARHHLVAVRARAHQRKEGFDVPRDRAFVHPELGGDQRAHAVLEAVAQQQVDHLLAAHGRQVLAPGVVLGPAARPPTHGVPIGALTPPGVAHLGSPDVADFTRATRL
jgi:hypothetical protein